LAVRTVLPEASYSTLLSLKTPFLFSSLHGKSGQCCSDHSGHSTGAVKAHAHLYTRDPSTALNNDSFLSHCKLLVHMKR
jgi:hypothetical protein